MFGVIFHGRIKEGQREAFTELMRRRVMPGEPFGLHSIELAWADADPLQVAAIIRFEGREGYAKHQAVLDWGGTAEEVREHLEAELVSTEVTFAEYLGKPLLVESVPEGVSEGQRAEERVEQLVGPIVSEPNCGAVGLVSGLTGSLGLSSDLEPSELPRKTKT